MKKTENLSPQVLIIGSGNMCEDDCRIYDLERRKEENVKLNNNDLFGENILGYSI